jgi:methyl-accepting chemotaxis protein
VLGVGLGSYFVGSAIVAEMSAKQMQTVASAHADKFTTYLKTIQSDLVNSAANESALGAARDFAVAWKNFAKATPALDARWTRCVQALHHRTIPHPAGRTPDAGCQRQTGRTNYDTTHDKVQATFRQQTGDARGYRDLYILDTEGNLVYSVMKNDDFASNFGEGGSLPIAGLGRAFRGGGADRARPGGL